MKPFLTQKGRAAQFLKFALLILLASPLIAEDTLTAESLLQKHLDSIGSASVRNAAKTRVVQGAATYKVLVGGSGQTVGNAVIASDGSKLHMLLKIAALQFRGERFISSGDKVYIAGTYDDKRRSEFGQFMVGEDRLIREGLLGGTLTTGWALQNLEEKKGKLTYRGSKRVDGEDLIAASYSPKKSAGMDITLYFDPKTFHHVRSIYQISQGAGLLSATEGGEVAAARQTEIRYRIEERFDDFKTADGLTLPARYDLRFTEELQNGFTKTIEWDLTDLAVQNNLPIDAKNFVLP